jgi:hypothetical protein
MQGANAMNVSLSPELAIQAAPNIRACERP